MVAIVTLDGASIGLDASSLGKLRERLKGGVILAGDPGYDEARRIWNGNIDRRPALIARCVDASDVRHAVSFAARHRLLLSVKGGAHSAPGYSTNDGGMVIDLSPMKAVSVDPAKRRARCQGGVLWCELDTATRPRRHRRHRLQHRCRRPHIGRWHGLADGQAWRHRR